MGFRGWATGPSPWPCQEKERPRESRRRRARIHCACTLPRSLFVHLERANEILKARLPLFHGRLGPPRLEKKELIPPRGAHNRSQELRSGLGRSTARHGPSAAGKGPVHLQERHLHPREIFLGQEGLRILLELTPPSPDVGIFAARGVGNGHFAILGVSF